MKRILIAGEGPCELGGFAKELQYREDPPEDGVIAGLLRRQCGSASWTIGDGFTWRRLPKYKSGAHRSNERRTVKALVQRAGELGMDVVAFVRDRDGDLAREGEIEKGLSDAADELTNPPLAIGGVATRNIEAWMVALGGVPKSESFGVEKLEEEIGKLGLKLKASQGYAEHIESSQLSKIPSDAESLRRWLDRASKALVP